MKKRIYLAAPYTHSDEQIRENRFLKVTAQAIDLMNAGENVYSPLTHGHLLSIMGDLPVDFEFWATSCLSYIEHWATDLYVLTLPDWEKSVGVAAEIKKAQSLGISVTYI